MLIEIGFFVVMSRRYFHRNVFGLDQIALCNGRSLATVARLTFMNIEKLNIAL